MAKRKPFKIEWSEKGLKLSLLSCTDPRKLSLAYLWIGDDHGKYLGSLDFVKLRRKLEAFRKRALRPALDKQGEP